MSSARSEISNSQPRRTRPTPTRQSGRASIVYDGRWWRKNDKPLPRYARNSGWPRISVVPIQLENPRMHNGPLFARHYVRAAIRIKRDSTVCAKLIDSRSAGPCIPGRCCTRSFVAENRNTITANKIRKGVLLLDRGRGNRSPTAVEVALDRWPVRERRVDGRRCRSHKSIPSVFGSIAADRTMFWISVLL